MFHDLAVLISCLFPLTYALDSTNPEILRNQHPNDPSLNHFLISRSTNLLSLIGFPSQAQLILEIGDR